LKFISYIGSRDHHPLELGKSGKMVFGTIDVKREQNEFVKEVEELKRWWKSPRWRKTKRYFV
jgi:hypothetical protein